MKITLTGSLGHITKPLAIALIEKGHLVTIISSQPERQKEIESLGASAAIGTMKDADFLSRAFAGAEIVYAMETLGEGFFFNQNIDYMTEIRQIANNYKDAILRSGVKKVVHLSSIGAHTATGNGMLAFHWHAEKILSQLPADVSIKTMRPVGFYINMFAFISGIKNQGVITSNYGGDEKEPWVAPIDIAGVIAEEMEKPFNGRNMRYIASDEASPNEVAQILGNAIAAPDLKWVVVSDEKMLNGMIAAGMNSQIAKGLVEMNASRRGGILYEDYHKNRPALCDTKLIDFAKNFAVIYNANSTH